MIERTLVEQCRYSARVYASFREWAAFHPFIERDKDGKVTFANRTALSLRLGFPGSTIKRRRWKRHFVSRNVKRVSDQITRASNLAGARRWLCGNPIDTFMMRAEDAVAERRLGKE